MRSRGTYLVPLLTLLALAQPGPVPPAAASPPAAQSTGAAAESVSWTGRVLARGSLRPVSGAAVRIEPPEPSSAEDSAASTPRAFTDDDGRFEVRAPEGARLRLSADGFLDGHVELTPGRETDLGMLVLREEMSLAGRLVRGGAPLSGALVLAPPDRGDGEPPPMPRARTDAGGRFHLAGMRPEHLSRLLIVGDDLGQWLELGHGYLWPVDARHYELGDVALDAPRRLSGRVVDRRGRPVPGAAVWPTSAGALLAVPGRPTDEVGAPLPYPTASTDDAGVFSLRLPPGAYEIAVLAPGLGFASRYVEVAGDDGPAELDPIRLEPGIIAAGRVVDGAGEPLAGAEATLEYVEGWPPLSERAADPPVTRTDAAGCYRFTGIPAGAWINVRAEHRGQLTGTLGARVARDAGPGGPEAGCGTLPDLDLPRPGRIVGRVVDPGGRPVAGAKLHPEFLQNPRPGPWRPPLPPTESDGDGRFVLGGLAPGDYELRVERHGYLIERVGVVEATPEGDAEVSVRLEPVARAFPLTVVLRDHRGAPVPEARVAAGLTGADRPLTPPPPDALTGADGRAVFDDLPAGTYSLSARAPGLGAGVPWQDPLRLDAPRDPVSLQLPSPAAPPVPVSGRLVGPDGRGISAAVVHLKGELVVRPELQALTGATGEFRLDGVPQGDYLVTATRRGHPGLLRQRPLPVGPDGRHGLLLRLPEPGEIRGRVAGLPEAARSGLSVRAYRTARLSEGTEAWIEATARTDADGAFRLARLAPGTWHLEADAEDGREATATVELSRPGEVADAVLPFPGGVTLTGTVRWRGEPAGRVHLSLTRVFPADPLLHRGARTDDDGRYTVGGLSPGRYVVVAGIPELRSPYMEPVEIDATAGAASRDVDARGGRLAGRVVDADTGEPIPAARVRTDPIQEHGFYIADAHDQFHRTDADGRFSAGPFAAGDWRIEVTAAGYARREPLVTIDDEDVRDLRIELEPTPGLRLRFQLPTDGLPDTLGLVWQDDATGEVYRRTAFPRSTDSPGYHWLDAPLGGGLLTVRDRQSGYLARLEVDNRGQSVDVVLRRGGALRVTVAPLRETGLQATLSLRDETGRPVAPGSGDRGHLLRTLHDGGFPAILLPPGSYRVEVWAEDGRSWSESLRIDAGRTTTVVLGDAPRSPPPELPPTEGPPLP